MATLRKGSSGEEVERLQQSLADAGYDVGGVDGIYGDKTAAAVRSYQKANGLLEDGIAGEQTLGKLYSPSPTATGNSLYQTALQAVKDKQAATPTTYDAPYEKLYQQIMNGEKFQYDLNGDALWQQYKDRYITQGRMAMEDTMGKAAALTGGYGNSAAQAVGQQTYQGYMQQLTDKIPELEQLARQKYLDEQQLLKDKFAITGQMREDEYTRHRTELGDLRQEAETAYSHEQDAYSKLVDVIIASGYTPTAAELEAAGMTPGKAAAYAKYYADQQADTAAAAKVSDSTYKQVLDYKGIGYDSYDKFADAMRDYAKTNGNKAMYDKLAGYVAAGMIDDVTAQNLYDMFWAEEGQKEPMTREGDSIAPGQTATWRDPIYEALEELIPDEKNRYMPPRAW